MKIIELRAENIKRLVAVDIKPNSNVVEITGKNGQGKTSVLDSIWWALGGAKDIQKSPIRNGADFGFVRLDLGDIVVTRSFARKDDVGDVTTKLTVENKEGVKMPSPQALLDKLLGDLCFDPLAFARATSEEQFNKLRTFVPDVDFKAIDAANKKDYEARTDLNRRAKERRAAAAQIANTPNIPAERIDETALLNEMDKASKHNTDIEVRKNNRRNLEIKRKELLEQVDDLMAQVADIKAKLDAAGPLPELIDVTALKNRINEARATNEAIALSEQKKNHETTAKQLEVSAEELTKKIEQRDADKQSKIAAAKLPVKGISFGDGIVLLNGVPFEQASDAEQLRASIGIAMALNSKLRVIRVRDGSLLDDESMKIVAEMADQNDFQVWIELVDGSGKVGFVLEAGEVKSVSEPEGEPDVF